ncbi:MAG: transcriptional regulator, Crp/Fnr family [Marmoricola sp.]|nr:transcriptional regulator, Crp/Fnr family [Marmoricola sp.]
MTTPVRGSAGSVGGDLFAAFSEHVAPAWETSFMSSFPARVTEALLDGAEEAKVAVGDVFLPAAAGHLGEASLVLILDGLVRTYIRAHTERQITIRYAWPGDVLGVPALVLAGAGSRIHGSYGGHALHAEALRETRVLNICAERFLKLGQSEPSVAYGVATLLAYLTVETEQMLQDGLFLSVRARVARHLLELAVWHDGALVVPHGQSEIADAIGSVREVVSRTLIRLRSEGVVDRRENATVLVDPASLHAIAAAG